jgi:DNA-binding beta-propeller fold protein YncE
MSTRKLAIISLFLLIAYFSGSETPSHFQFIKQVKTGREPKDVLFSPDDRYLMITLLDDLGLNIYDRRTEQLLTVNVPEPYRANKGFVEGVFNQQGTEFWFTQMAVKGRVFVLNMQTLNITHVIGPVGNWTKVGEFSPDGSLYCVTNWLSHDVTVIDTRTYTIVKTFKCSDGREPRGVGFSEDGQYVYVVFFASGQIMKFSINEDYKLVSKIYTGGTNGRFRVDYQKQVAYINNMLLNQFFVFDFKTGQIIRKVKTWINPNNLKLSPDKRYIYISNRGPNNPQNWLLRSPENGRIQIFDSEKDFELIEELKVGNQPIGIALTSDHKLLAISNFQDDNIVFYAVSF